MNTSGLTKLQRVNKSKLNYAKELRKNMTEAEIFLWERLRRKKINGLKFRRQQVIDGYIVDFYCEKLRLVIEVDGEIHKTEKQKKYDKHRKVVFETRGIKELRFDNEVVVEDIEFVLEEIANLSK